MRCDSCLRRDQCGIRQKAVCKELDFSDYVVDLQEHGHWEAYYVCSVCGETVRKIGRECPFCHAVMDGKE